MLLNHAFVRLCGVFNSILKDVPLRRQKLLDLVKARPAFTAGAIDQLADLKPVAAHGASRGTVFSPYALSARGYAEKYEVDGTDAVGQLRFIRPLHVK